MNYQISASSNSLSAQIAPAVIPLDKPIAAVYPSNNKQSICAEEYKSTYESQLWFLSITEQRKLRMKSFPMDVFGGGCTEWMGFVTNDQMVFLDKLFIDILDIRERKLLVQHRAKLSRNDVGPEYFHAKLVDKEKLWVIDLMSPSPDPKGELNDAFYSLLLEDLKSRTVLKHIAIAQASDGLPPVFFDPDIIVYRNNRFDSTESWKALDNTLSEVSYPLCDLLNDHFKSSCIWELSISSKNKHAFLQRSESRKGAPTFWYLSWLNGPRAVQVPSSLADIQADTHFSISPSGKWVHLFGQQPNQKNQEITHVLFYMDPTLPDGFLPPFTVNTGTDEDLVTWMNDPEGLVILHEGNLFWWDLSKFDPKAYLAKQH